MEKDIHDEGVSQYLFGKYAGKLSKRAQYCIKLLYKQKTEIKQLTDRIESTQDEKRYQLAEDLKQDVLDLNNECSALEEKGKNALYLMFETAKAAREENADPADLQNIEKAFEIQKVALTAPVIAILKNIEQRLSPAESESIAEEGEAERKTKDAMKVLAAKTRERAVKAKNPKTDVIKSVPEVKTHRQEIAAAPENSSGMLKVAIFFALFLAAPAGLLILGSFYSYLYLKILLEAYLSGYVTAGGSKLLSMLVTSPLCVGTAVTTFIGGKMSNRFFYAKSALGASLVLTLIEGLVFAAVLFAEGFFISKLLLGLTNTSHGSIYSGSINLFMLILFLIQRSVYSRSAKGVEKMPRYFLLAETHICTAAAVVSSVLMCICVFFLLRNMFLNSATDEVFLKTREEFHSYFRRA